MELPDPSGQDGGGALSSRAIPPPQSTEKAPTVTETSFQFIDLSQDTPEQRSRNRTMARSHVMKKVRRGQKRRRETESSRRGRQPACDDRVVDVSQSQRPYGSQNMEVRSPSSDLYCEAFATTMIKNLSSSCGSMASRIEADISPLPMFIKRWTPLVHEMIDHNLKVIWPLFWPVSSPGELSPMAIDWWRMFRSSPMLFHASTHAAAAHLDSLRSSTALTGTTEALAHKTEAIRLINQELSNMQLRGGIPDDVLLMAILSMTSETSDSILPDDYTHNPAEQCLFKPPLMPLHWQKQFAKIRSAKYHQQALFTLVRMKGGLENVQNPCVAKSLSHHELLAAAMELRKPQFSFFEAREIAMLAENPWLNALMAPMDEDRGSGLPGLLEYGVTEQALKVFVDLQQISVIIEAYTQGTLQNPNVLSLTSRRNAIHHALLSLPTKEELEGLTDDQKYLYESCRLAALCYDLAIIFPMPLFTGVMRRLVSQIQSVVESLSVEALFGSSARVFIWVLFTAGTAAERMLERPWFVQRLKALLASEGINQWSGLKAVVNSYLWMSSAMDEPAMDLWDEIANLKLL